MQNAEHHKPLFHRTTTVSWIFLGFPTLAVTEQRVF